MTTAADNETPDAPAKRALLYLRVSSKRLIEPTARGYSMTQGRSGPPANSRRIANRTLHTRGPQ